jgi:hypothetical protein
MQIEKDGHNQRYVELATGVDERVRLTFIPAKDAGYKRDSIRVQIRDQSGHLRMGPELPVDVLGSVSAAAIALLAERSK